VRIVIAGGTGFIGKALAGRLLAAGREVVVLTRSPSRAGPPRPGLVYAAWDGIRGDSFASHVDGAYAVINLAGESIASGRWTPERKRRIRQSRIDAGKAVAEAVRLARNKPQVLIQASAVGYYGDRGNEILAEDAGPGQGFLAETAAAWEAGARDVAGMGVRCAIIRTGVVIAPHGGVLQRMLPPFRLFLGGPLGDGTQFFPWIHLEDETRAVEFLLENPSASGPYNLAAPGETDMNGFCRALGAALGRPSLFRVPAFVLRLAFGEMADEAILASVRARPQRLVEAGFVFSRPHLEDAFLELRGRP